MTRKNNYTIVCLVFCVLSFFIISCNKKASNNKIILISAISEDVSTMLLELSADSLIGFKEPCFFKNGQALVSQKVDKEGDGQSDVFLIYDPRGFQQGQDLLITDGYKGVVPETEKKTQAELWHKTTGKFKDGRYVGGGNFSRFDSLRVPDGFMDHAYFIKYEGPGWESDKVGYRLYLDWRNAIDVFGKKVKTPVLQEVGVDGYESYHYMQDWGMDVLKVGSSLGIGTTAWWTGKAAMRVEKTDSVKCRILSDGNIRSQVQVWYYGWDLNGDRVNLNSIKSIDAGSRMTHEYLRFNQAVSQVCTGIRKDSKAELIILNSNKKDWQCMATWGVQSLNNDKLGLAIIYPTIQNPVYTEDKHSHVVMFDKALDNVEYYFLAAWELESEGVSSKEDFMRYLQQELSKLESPLKYSLQ